VRCREYQAPARQMEVHQVGEADLAFGIERGSRFVE
jgi:hypothetical protein